MLYINTIGIALLSAAAVAFKIAGEFPGNGVPQMYGKWIATDDENLQLLFANGRQVYHLYKNVATDTFDYHFSSQGCDTTVHDTAHNTFLVETNKRDTLCFQVSFYEKNNSRFMTMLRGASVFTYRKYVAKPKHATRY